jgi:hypothetical protein
MAIGVEQGACRSRALGRFLVDRLGGAADTNARETGAELRYTSRHNTNTMTEAHYILHWPHMGMMGHVRVAELLGSVPSVAQHTGW